MFHRIRDAGSMRSRTFLKLAARLPAYHGALASRMAADHRQQQPAAAQRQAPRPRYERTSVSANNARSADSAPPATGADLARLNNELGATWFSHRIADAGGES